MSKKTKKQHYVPRCYLEAWAIPSKYQVHVYDTEIEKARINSINDVASENYFYDVAPNQVFSQEMLDALYELGILSDEAIPSQGIEHVFANYVEGPFSKLLKELIDKCDSATPWIIDNCYFILDQQKVDISELLALQYVRTKQVRNNLMESANCLEQVLKEIGASPELLAEHTINKEGAKNIHSQMLMDLSNLSEIAKCFWSLTWMLGINRTGKSFYTSDTPIGTHAHIKHPIMSMNGLQSKGVEAYFPISPTYMLIMFDGAYHTHNAHLERRYVLIHDEESVDFYNSLCAIRSQRCIFSCDGDFNLIDTMKQKDPKIFHQPQTKIIHAGKDYYPKV